MAEHHDILIVGAGHAGAQLALALRQRKFAGSIGIVTDEPVGPYERPPLSKSYLAGSTTLENLWLRPPAMWDSRRVQLLLGRRVEAVQSGAHTVQLTDRSSHSYGHLVWAAGGRARRLMCNGAQLRGIHSIRTQQDVDLLRSELAGAVRIVIVGGGYIGLESAATLVKLGKQVTLLEASPHVLARVSGPPVATFLASEHARHGVEFQMGVAVAGIRGEQGQVRSVLLADGSELAADLVIVGIGIDPNIEVLATAGAAVGNGVRVDAQCRTSLPDILAIGDCTLHPNRFSLSGWARLESVPNAMDQAAVAAKVLTGENASQDSVPWFWSDQYDLKLQTAGLSTGYDNLVVRGDPDTRAFSVVYLREGKVVAIDCVNSPRDFVQGKQLVARAAAPEVSQIATVAELKALVA